jgi:squalene synthase HpnC
VTQATPRPTTTVPPPAVEALAAKARAENFPVALRVLPPATRAHLRATYGFARFVDDLGDDAPGDRLELLAWADAELTEATAGAAGHPVFAALGPTLARCGQEPFRRLIEANRRDQRVHRYRTWNDLRDYCTYSATPVGLVVLRIFGAESEERVRWSDDVCIALQLIEHLQDVGEDLRRGRVYLPEEDRTRFGVHETDLAATSAGPPLRALIAFECERARALLDSAAPLVRSLSGFARVAVTGYAAGGFAALDAIEGAHHDVLAVACRPSRARTLRHAVTLARGRVPGAGGRR